MNRKGFTLVELLSVILIIGFLILIGGLLVVERIMDEKDNIKRVSDSLIVEAANQFISDNKEEFFDNHSYCIKIKTLADSDYLSSPVVDAVSGKNIEDKVIFVRVSSSGNFDQVIMDASKCKEK